MRASRAGFQLPMTACKYCRVIREREEGGRERVEREREREAQYKVIAQLFTALPSASRHKFASLTSIITQISPRRLLWPQIVLSISYNLEGIYWLLPSS